MASLEDKKSLMDSHNPKDVKNTTPRMPKTETLGKNKAGKDILPKN